MAAVELTISGVLYDKINRTTQPVVLIGEASLTGLGIGGGPIYPPEGGGGGGDKPPYPGGKPPGIWGGPWFPPRPTHPIVLPDPIDPPVDPPTEPPTQPPNPAWSWCWSPQYGWHPAYVAGDKPQPPGTPPGTPPVKK